jgi:hypothetical protein
MKKKYWKDALPLRKPNGKWRIDNATRYFEELLGIPPGSIEFVRLDGKPIKPTGTVGSLRAKKLNGHS